MRGHLLAIVCLTAVAGVGGTGCGGVYYAVTVNAAESRLAQAREMGAESASPYEYYYAREHLREAYHQASEASYGDAANYAETAETYAQKAIDLIQKTKRGDAPKGATSSDGSGSGKSEGKGDGKGEVEDKSEDWK